MSLLAEQLVAVHEALSGAGLPHAFGGAIALAYCTEEPRGTRDLDVNVFVEPSRAREVFEALPRGVNTSEKDLEAAESEGQVRVWWEETPVDLFLDVHRFHKEIATNVRMVPFANSSIPVLDCTALAVFKALFDRTKDWADIEEMAAVGALDIPEATAWLQRLAGDGSPAARRMASQLVAQRVSE